MPEAGEAKNGETAEAVAKTEVSSTETSSEKTAAKEKTGRRNNRVKDKKPAPTVPVVSDTKKVENPAAETKDKKPESEETKAEDKKEETPTEEKTVKKEETAPIASAEKIEEEKVPGKNQKIEDLIAQIKNGEWEENQRQAVLKARYGGRGDSFWQKFRAFMGGEQDVTFRGGKVEYHREREILRRTLSVLGYGAETAAIIAAIGLIPGVGSGAAVSGILPALRSMLGRGAVELYQGMSPTERNLRAKLLVAREAYYSQAKMLAAEIGPEKATEDFATSAEFYNYQKHRNDTIESLVKFVNSAEKHSIEDIYGKTGQPMISQSPPDVGGPGIPISEVENTGTKVSSPDSRQNRPETIAELEKQLADYKSRMEKIKIGASLISGLGGTAWGIVRNQARWVSEGFHRLTTTLQSGQAVSLDINGDHIRHLVQTTSGAVKNIFETSTRLVFHYNSLPETLRAAQSGVNFASNTAGEVLRQSPFFSHELGATGAQLYQGILRESERQLIDKMAAIGGGILLSGTLQYLQNHSTEKNFSASRAELEKQQNYQKEKLAPENNREMVQRHLRESGKPPAEIGSEWVIYSNDTAGNLSEQKIKIISTKEFDGEDWLEYETDLIVGGQPIGRTEVKMMRLGDLAYSNAHCIRRGESPVQAETEKAKQASGGTIESESKDEDKQKELTKQKDQTKQSDDERQKIIDHLTEVEKMPTDKKDMFRAMSNMVLSRLTAEQIQSLSSLDKIDADKLFKQFAREVLADQFVTHFTGKSKSGKPFPDLDGKCAVNLFDEAGIEIGQVTQVKPGESIKGKIDVDTGMKNGVESEGDFWQEVTLYLDHHGRNAGRDKSATSLVYEVLLGLGMLEDKPELRKLVDFVTEIDNLNYPSQAEIFDHSDRTMYGLYRYLGPGNPNRGYKLLKKFFAEGKDPAANLSDEDLKKYGLAGSYDGKSYNRQVEHQKKIEQSNARIKELEKDDWVVESKNFGKILVNVVDRESKMAKVNLGAEAAYAKGFDTYLLYDAAKNSFFLSSNRAFPKNFNLSQGQGVRENMWIKPQSETEELELTLKDLLSAMLGPNFIAEGKLKEYLENPPQVDKREKKYQFEVGTSYEAIIKLKMSAEDYKQLTSDNSGNFENLGSDKAYDAEINGAKVLLRFKKEPTSQNPRVKVEAITPRAGGFELRVVEEGEAKTKEEKSAAAAETETEQKKETKQSETEAETAEDQVELEDYEFLPEFTIYRKDSIGVDVKIGDVLVNFAPGVNHYVAKIVSAKEGREIYFFNADGEAIGLPDIDLDNFEVRKAQS